MSRKLMEFEASPPLLFPEYTGEDRTTYIYRDHDFWTSGFFPGSLYVLLERQIRYPRFSALNGNEPSITFDHTPHEIQLRHVCQWWTENLHSNARKTDTHDLGFMMGPWAMRAWAIDRDAKAYSSLLTAAHSLASRYDNKVRSLRSWDVCVTKRYQFTDPSKDFLVIIDNMLNLDLLFWAARETSSRGLYDIAVAHARTTQRHHIRNDNTTFHVVNFDAKTGLPKAKFTNQGYSDESCWSRGQAWGILGFVQTFNWTGEKEFLDTARSLADYFITKLPDDGVPYWDFAAPITDSSPRDTSAAMIATCGLLLIYKALKDAKDEQSGKYLNGALKILAGTLAKFLNPPTLKFEVVKPAKESLQSVYADGGAVQSASDKQQPGLVVVEDLHLKTCGQKSADTILDGATINNYEYAPRRWANHGLVYADYFFLVVGNLLLEMGLVGGAVGALNF